MKVFVNVCGCCLVNDVPLIERFLEPTHDHIWGYKCIDILQQVFPDLKFNPKHCYKLCHQCSTLLQSAHSLRTVLLRRQRLYAKYIRLLTTNKLNSNKFYKFCNLNVPVENKEDIFSANSNEQSCDDEDDDVDRDTTSCERLKECGQDQEEANVVVVVGGGGACTPPKKKEKIGDDSPPQLIIGGDKKKKVDDEAEWDKICEELIEHMQQPAEEDDEDDDEDGDATKDSQQMYRKKMLSGSAEGGGESRSELDEDMDDLPPQWGNGDPDSELGELRKGRTAYTPLQVRELEKAFLKDMYLPRHRKTEVAQRINLSERQIRIWFQNRRMKVKRDRARRQRTAAGKPCDTGSNPISSDNPSSSTLSPYSNASQSPTPVLGGAAPPGDIDKDAHHLVNHLHNHNNHTDGFIPYLTVHDYNHHHSSGDQGVHYIKHEFINEDNYYVDSISNAFNFMKTEQYTRLDLPVDTGGHHLQQQQPQDLDCGTNKDELKTEAVYFNL